MAFISEDKRLSNYLYTFRSSNNEIWVGFTSIWLYHERLSNMPFEWNKSSLS